MEYFDKILQTIWCWKNLDQGIAKWHLSSVEALPSAKFSKSETDPTSGTEWNILINFCANFDIDKIWPKRLRTGMFIGRGFAKLQILKKWKWHYLLNCEEYYDEILHTHWYWQAVASEIVKWHLGLVEVLPRFKFWKKWNWPYLLNLLVYFDKIFHTYYYWHDLDRGIAKSSWRDCKMTFNIGRGCAELKILKK